MDTVLCIVMYLPKPSILFTGVSFFFCFAFLIATGLEPDREKGRTLLHVLLLLLAVKINRMQLEESFQKC
jgi:hypothetical protein